MGSGGKKMAATVGNLQIGDAYKIANHTTGRRQQLNSTLSTCQPRTNCSKSCRCKIPTDSYMVLNAKVESIRRAQLIVREKLGQFAGESVKKPTHIVADESDVRFGILARWSIFCGPRLP